MSATPVTSLYTGLLGLQLLVLSVLVIRQRLRAKVALGLGTDPLLLRASRAQGNFVEYAPLLVLLLLSLELAGWSTWLLHLLGLMIVVGRVAHAAGISREPEVLVLRQVGMLLTFAALAIGSVLALLPAG